MRSKFLDINDYDCVEWHLIDPDIENIKSHILCIRCNKWYLRKSKYLNEQCSSCCIGKETKRIKSSFVYRSWKNETSIVIQKKFKHNNSRSISIPLAFKNSENFSKGLIDKLKDGLSWIEAKEKAQKFKSLNDKETLIKKLSSFQEQCSSTLIIINDLLLDLKNE